MGTGGSKQRGGHTSLSRAMRTMRRLQENDMSKAQTICSAESGDPGVSAGAFFFHCNICFKMMEELVTRFHCFSGCEDFDLCEECYAKGGHPHQLVRQTTHASRLVKQIYQQPTPGQKLLSAFAAFADRPCIGTRAAGHAEKVVFEWRTYQQMMDLSCSCARGLVALLAKQKQSTRRMGIFDSTDAVILCLPNCAEYLAADFACALSNLVSVPVHCALRLDALTEIIIRTRPFVAIVGAAELPMFAQAAASKAGACLGTIVVNGTFLARTSIPGHLEPQGADVISFTSLLASGGGGGGGDLSPVVPGRGGGGGRRWGGRWRQWQWWR
jgi:hypothetical protein